MADRHLALRGHHHNPITQAEKDAGLTVSDLDERFAVGYVLRYGENTTPGVTDMSPTWQSMFNANDGREVIISPEQHKLDSEVTLPASVIIQAEVATIIAASQSGTVFTRAIATANVSYAVSSQVKDTAVVTTSSPPSGLVAGNYCYLTTSSFNGDYPINLRRVKSVSGNTVTLDNLINIAYPGTVTLVKITHSGDFVMNGGTFSCSGIADTLDNLIELRHYAHVTLVNVRVFDADLGLANFTSVFSITGSRSVLCDNVKVDNCIAHSSALNTNNCSVVTYRDGKVEGDLFGLNTRHTDHYFVYGNDLKGRFGNGGAISVRGIKSRGCFDPHIYDNVVKYFDTNIRVEESANSHVHHNTLGYCNIGVQVLDGTTDVASFSHHMIDHNSVDKAQQIAISTGPENDHVTICHNPITNAEADGIQAQGDAISVYNNPIDEWDLGSTGAYAIHFANAKTLPSLCAGNPLRTATSTKNAINFQTSATLVKVYGNTSNTDVLYNAYPVTKQFDSADATPSVAISNDDVFRTNGSTTITDFDDGHAGQRIMVYSTANIIFDTTGTNLTGSSVDLSTGGGDVTFWFCLDGITWILEGFVDVSADNSGGA